MARATLESRGRGLPEAMGLASQLGLLSVIHVQSLKRDDRLPFRIVSSNTRSLEEIGSFPYPEIVPTAGRSELKVTGC